MTERHEAPVIEATKPLNIYQRLNEARRRIAYIQKDAVVSTGAGSKGYKAVTHDQVVALTRVAFIDLGVMVIPTLIECDMEQPLEGTKQRLFSSIFSVGFFNEDSPEDHITINLPAQAMDSGDKAPGKAASYAVKTAILKMLMIETGESDESRYAPEDDGLCNIFIEQIAGAPNVDVLKGLYAAAMEATDDKAGMELIIEAASKRRKELTKAEEK
jgi:hypothetical protein